MFRSAAPETVGWPAFLAVLEQHGINTVVDLRTSRERGGDSPGLSIPLFEVIEPHWERPTDLSPQATAARYYEMLQAGRPALGRIQALLAKPESGPLLFHCAKGRDRTGIVIAWLLLSRGADPEAIADDYALFGSSEPGDTAPQRETMVELLRILLPGRAFGNTLFSN